MAEIKFEIESGIPIPPKNYSGGARSKYPFATMEPGQSIFLPGNDRKARTQFAQAAYYVTKRTGKRFTVRPDQRRVNGVVEQGWRCWRIE